MTVVDERLDEAWVEGAGFVFHPRELSEILDDRSAVIRFEDGSGAVLKGCRLVRVGWVRRAVVASEARGFDVEAECEVVVG